MTDTRSSHRPEAPEVKFTRLDLKQVSAEGRFAGYACLFGEEDLAGDVVERGAFAESLAKRGPRGIKMLFQHDPAEPIGVWERLREEPQGLWAEGRLMREVARAREVLSLMREGALDGLSIGFKTIEGRRDPKAGVRRLLKIDLWEISVVTFPMQPGARIQAVKAHPFENGIPTEREFERWLKREAGLTRNQARLMISQGFRALARKLEARGDADDEARLVALIEAAAAQIRQASTR